MSEESETSTADAPHEIMRRAQFHVCKTEPAKPYFESTDYLRRNAAGRFRRLSNNINWDMSFCYQGDSPLGEAFATIDRVFRTNAASARQFDKLHSLVAVLEQNVVRTVQAFITQRQCVVVLAARENPRKFAGFHVLDYVLTCHLLDVFFGCLQKLWDVTPEKKSVQARHKSCAKTPMGLGKYMRKAFLQWRIYPNPQIR